MLSSDLFDNVKGPVVLFGAALFFAIFDAMLNYLSHNIPSGEIILSRFLVGLIISAPALIRYIHNLDGRSLILLIARGVVGGVAIFSLLQAFRLGTLSGSMVLLSTHPIWALVLSALLLREPLTRQRVAGVLAAFLGAVLVINPWQEGISAGDLLGLAAGAFSGTAMVITRHLRARFDTFVIYGFHCIVGAAMSIPLVVHDPVVPQARIIILLFVVSLLGLVGQLGMTYGLRYVRAAEGAVIIMTESIVAVCLGVLLFHETIGLNFLAGAAMILGSGVALARIGVYDVSSTRRSAMDSIREVKTVTKLRS
jgi:drug/metabolite transporter (DMT)-like permease